MKKVKIIALVAAVLAGLALYQFLDIISQPPETPTTTVVVAAVDIPENTEITAEMLTLAAIPTEAVLPTAVLDMKNAVGLVMSSDVLAGEQIVTGRLVQVGEKNVPSNTLAYVVEPGKRAITIGVSYVGGIATMIKPGNRVDVVMCYSQELDEIDETAGQEKKEEPAARLLVQNVEVLAVDGVMSKQGVTGEGATYSSVTLSVTPEQAVELSYAEAVNSLRLILRSQLDEDTVDLPTVTAEEMQR